MASNVKLTKDTVEIDLSGVSASDRKRKVVIPEGVYRAKVISVSAKKFSTDSQGVVWVYEITDKGKGKGARFWNNNVLKNADGSVAENNLWSFRAALQALEPKVKIKDSMMKVPLSKLAGRTVALEIADGEDDKGKPRSEIIDVFHESLIEEDDEEMEEDDDLDSDDEDEAEEEEEDEDDDEIDLDEDEL